MGFWFIFLCDLAIPVTLLIAGIVMWKHPPKQINGIVGYRSARSMQNMDTWKFAQAYCGKFCWKTGLALAVPTLIAHIPFYQSPEETLEVLSMILLLVQIIVVFIPVLLTERALRKTFREDGTKR
ncbi:MAG: SdpI family protein [Clostridia bacterium]|nr:SdpI family protein [Clostridia bacterium]